MGSKSNYGKGLYDQLQEVMVRLDSVEKANKEETIQLKEDLSALKKETWNYGRKTSCCAMISHGLKV